MRKYSIFFIFFLPFISFAQFKITGKIVNHNDKKPLPNASVFLGNATIGDRTDENGFFTLSNVKAGKYELIVSIIGYETHREALMITNSNITLPDIEITPKVIALKEVNITPHADPEREKNYDRFKDEFLGTSDLSKECKIINPEVIDLSYDKKTQVLTASTADFLEIENKALGYKIKYLLTKFEWNNRVSNSPKLQYEGSALFEEMKGTESEKKKWLKQRRQAYEGSEMHFFRAVLGNRLEAEGFRVLQLPISYNSKLKELPLKYPLTTQDILKITPQDGLYALGCDGDALHVTYNKRHHFPKEAQMDDLNSNFNTGSTILRFNTPYAFFDSNGGIINPNSILLTGAMGRNRVADLLPVDFEEPGNAQIQNNEVQASVNKQLSPLAKELLKQKEISDSLFKMQSPEKIYVQLDKPYYALGDTIWFKAWLLKAATRRLAVNSDLIHVDMISDNGNDIKRFLFRAQDGLANGNITLTSKDFTTGGYTFYAYTNWMRNASEDGFFRFHLDIVSIETNGWLVTSKITASVSNGQNKINAQMQLTDINKTPFGMNDVSLNVLSNTKIVYKQTIKTDANGLIDVNFLISGKPGHTIIAIDDNTKNHIAIIPVIVIPPRNIDLQFLPEGGRLVADLPAHIGFKALSEDGHGADVSGVIVDQYNTKATSFKSTHKGMGSFDFVPKKGGVYTAMVDLPDGSVKTYPLPTPKSSGTALRINNYAEKDSLQITVTVSNDLVSVHESYFLIGKANGLICYAAIIGINKSNSSSIKISKKLFPAGVIHFILQTTNLQPLNERLVYIDHHDELQLTLRGTREIFAPKDSISLNATVTDKDGEAVEGNFSIAVTDDAQVNFDSLEHSNIITRILLSSELKGYIEQPGYYFKRDLNAASALDNLLLTQGWISYDREESKDHSSYNEENEWTLRGQVLNVFNKPIAETHVQLMSKSPVFIRDTITNKEGRFIFNNFPYIETPVFIIKAVNRNGKSFNAGIKMDNPILPIPKTSDPLTLPWYVNSNGVIINYVRKRDSVNNPQKYIPGTHHLKEVKIIAKKIVKGSQNLNGPGNADLIMDEKDMEKAGKESWLQLFQEKIKRFKEGTYFNPVTHIPANTYYIEDQIVLLVIDGITYNSIFPFDGNNQNYFVAQQNYLKLRTAEEISGIEVSSSYKYLLKYSTRFNFPLFQYAVIEITTRSGQGPIIDNGPEITLYQPLALSHSKQFYKPKYILNDTTKHLPDSRSTIDWEPNVITDRKGHATVSFYAADKPGTYTVIMEGTDGNGNFGYKRQKIIVKNK